MDRPRSALTHGSSDDEAGFALVDALTALFILSVTIGISLAALETSRKLAASTADVRQARSGLLFLMDRPVGEPGVILGGSGGLRWTLSVEPIRAIKLASGAWLCQRKAAVWVSTRKRPYEAISLEPCPAKSKP